MSLFFFSISRARYNSGRSGDRMKINVKDYKNNDIIRMLREYSNLTQKDLAQKLEKSVRTVQRYEAGDIKIDLKIIREICELCDLMITIESKSIKKKRH